MDQKADDIAEPAEDVEPVAGVEDGKQDHRKEAAAVEIERASVWVSNLPLEANSDAAVAPEPERLHQLQLLAYTNPLRARFGAEFFRALPRVPGVYRMLGERGDILYVGKAKDLRARLNSYRQAKPGAVSRKVIRMVHMIRDIRWEECATEQAALLRENQLLREVKPPFNSLNTHPELYYFLALRSVGSNELRFRLTFDAKKKGDRLYGAFKSRSLTRGGYAALLRSLWIAHTGPAKGDRFEYPPRLTRLMPPAIQGVKCPADWHRDVHLFLAGSSETLVGRLTEKLLEHTEIPPFYYRMIQDDLDTLRSFFTRATRRSRELRKRHKIRREIILQHELDDLLVLSGSGQSRVPASASEGILEAGASSERRARRPLPSEADAGTRDCPDPMSIGLTMSLSLESDAESDTQ